MAHAQVVDESWNSERHKDWIGGIIAIELITILGFIVVASFVTIWLDRSTDLKENLPTILGSVSAIVAGVTGFYFGHRTRPQGQQPPT